MAISSAGTISTPLVPSVRLPKRRAKAAHKEKTAKLEPNAASKPETAKPKPRLELVDSVLARAEASIAAQRPHTVVDVLHHRALRHYAEGLRQYMAIRLGSVSAGQRAVRRLRALVASQASDALVQPPGIRARLYRMAHELSGEAEDDGEQLPWRVPREGKLAVRIQRLRDHIPKDDAELLELRFARELGPAEVAFVVGAPIEGVLESLHDATQHAAKLARTKPGDSLRRMLREAFALEASVPTTREVGTFLADQPALSSGSLIGGRYRVQARVGTGAFGDVYRAQDADVSGHVVALKVLHQPAYSDEARRTALRELQHLASVFHPSVVHLKDHGWHEGRLWFVMPWYDGETLESRLQRGPLERQEARRIFEQLARALAAVHAAGLRHQDVKPDNIFLAELPGDEQALPVLIDFGVAATEAEMLVAGTPTYFAPEVAAQFASVDQKPRVTSRADVFSLALALRNALDPDTQDDVPSGAVDAFIEERAHTSPKGPTQRSLRFLAKDFARWMNADAWERPSAEEFAEELALLTAPEERRDRRWKMLRNVSPVLLVLSIAFAGAWWHFEQRQSATEARTAAQVAEVREDLVQTDAERQRIATDAERIRGSLEAEQLGRAQLESQLATTQATLHGERARIESLAERAALRLSERDEARAELARSDQALDAQRERVAAMTQQLQTARAEHRSVTQELAQVRATHRDLERRVTRTQSDLEARDADLGRERARRAAAEARAETLEHELGEAIAARHAALRALAPQEDETPAEVAPLDVPNSP